MPYASTMVARATWRASRSQPRCSAPVLQASQTLGKEQPASNSQGWKYGLMRVPILWHQAWNVIWRRLTCIGTLFALLADLIRKLAVRLSTYDGTGIARKRGIVAAPTGGPTCI